MSQAIVNGKKCPVTGKPTVHQLLVDIGFGKRRIIVEHNGEPLPEEKLKSKRVSDGDRLEVVQLVGGG